jgi:hypothetical protein
MQSYSLKSPSQLAITECSCVTNFPYLGSDTAIDPCAFPVLASGLAGVPWLHVSVQSPAAHVPPSHGRCQWQFFREIASVGYLHGDGLIMRAWFNWLWRLEDPGPGDVAPGPSLKVWDSEESPVLRPKALGTRNTTAQGQEKREDKFFLGDAQSQHPPFLHPLSLLTQLLSSSEAQPSSNGSPTLWVSLT